MVFAFTFSANRQQYLDVDHPVGFVLFLCALWLVSNIIPDYLSLLTTRCGLFLLATYGSILAAPLLILLADAILTGYIALCGMIALDVIGEIIEGHFQGVSSMLASIWRDLCHPFKAVIDVVQPPNNFWFYFYPVFFPSIWLWLYARFGFLLKATRGLDIGFQWFNRHSDIEKKPLQSIGLVAGTLVALVYWSVVIVRRII